ncbi:MULTISPECIES: TetR/AcrR family transcriptional regulator [Methylobacteriaceae]|jgi:AcrR family transcriptional regulator|uniref:TetR/AcrR family transcriptional regulator n=1 Tax=Methylobacteriaceae TaxID=119045 RepID=UPI001EE59ACB|nr:TetR/AcrR family transcriptional regulator [Methylorubrum extorquens]MCG5248120.1 TetR/AcrR family transcriptional regulator [Methylorubrum extorquens]
MASAYNRRKQPELIRRALLDCAATLALEQGLAGVTVQAVSAAAGVTKGGLFHHFPSKQALVEGVAADLIERIDAEIDAIMARDPVPRGRFTRAYVETTFTDPAMGPGSRWTALYLSMIVEPGLRRLWAEWYAGRMDRHRATDDGPTLATVRLAADGAWLAQLMRDDGCPTPDLVELRSRLLAMTHGP